MAVRFDWACSGSGRGEAESFQRFPKFFQALPRIDEEDRNLRPIKGVPPNLIDLPDQCPFLPRCPKAIVDCRINPRPPLEEVEPDHLAACYNQVVHD